MGVNITQGGSGGAIKVQQRSDRSAQNDVLSEEGADTPQLPRFIYSKLGNLTNHKTISLSDMETEQDEYRFFMMELQRYYNTDIDIDNIKALDEYLGSLGVSLTYAFDDDASDIPLWITVDSDFSDRNVITSVSNIDYNIITNIDGIDYNVIHEAL